MAVIVDPLDASALARISTPPLRPPQLLASTPSTNSVLAAAARAGEPEGSVVVAAEQTAGRGRLGRSWLAPGDSGLAFSVLLRPDRPADQLGYLPLIAGVAVLEAVAPFMRSPIWLKWPNDVMVAEGKLAGILSELVAGAVVIGIGLNVHDHPALPAGAASVGAGAASAPRRTSVLAAVLAALADRYRDWLASPQRARAHYLRYCATVGATVVVSVPGGEQVRGRAVDVDEIGRLVLDTGGERRALASGDVVAVRGVDG
ncbi:MAG: biotin--[acetyl-CoA-carboxylase] ligase [Mycobacteriales bacterium]